MKPPLGPSIVAITVATLTALMLGSCSIPTESGETGDLPDKKSFIDTGVSTFMERRCGTLDCHGQMGRPLRIFSQWGLRKTATDGGTRDTRPTTAEEQTENYLAVVGLEPENLELCFRTKGEATENFQLLLKPLDTANAGIRHKGGPVLRPSALDPGWQCLFGWASGTLDPAQCVEAAKVQ